LTPPCVFAQANAAIANAVDGFFAAGILDLVGDPTAGTSGAAPGGGGGGGATANKSGPAKSAPSGGAVDGFPNEIALCPPGCEFYEEKSSHTYQFCRWAKVGRETKAVMFNKKEDDPDLAYFFAPATAKDTKSLTNLLAPTFKRHKDDAARRGKSKQVQHSFAAGEGFFDGIIDFAKKGKAMMREGAEDAAELNALVGGDGVVPAVTLPADSSTVCAICLKGPDDGKPVLPGSSSITLKCGHAFHAACWHKHSYSAHPSSRTCPVCRDPLAAPAAAAADPANDAGSESGGNTCSVCGRSDETGDDCSSIARMTPAATGSTSTATRSPSPTPLSKTNRRRRRSSSVRCTTIVVCGAISSSSRTQRSSLCKRAATTNHPRSPRLEPRACRPVR